MHTTIEKIERFNIPLIGVSAFIGWQTGYIHVPSLILGGIAMQVNFWLLKKVTRSALSPAASDAGGKSRALIWFVLKAIFFLVLLSALFYGYPVHGESFVIGVSLLLLACVIIGLSVPKGDMSKIEQTHSSTEKH